LKYSQRRFFVFVSLIAFMSATAALLLALAPQPLAPDLPQSLAAIDSGDAMEPVFQTDAPVEQSNWKYIYIRQSRTTGGDAMGLTNGRGDPGDHFVICNGRGAADGEIQLTPRWLAQLSALPPRGAESIDPACISICMVGDLDRNSPTPAQLRRVSRLVSALQTRLGIPARNVIAQPTAGTAAAAGSRFPTADFRSRILP
jgi:hypothetical protein